MEEVAEIVGEAVPGSEVYVFGSVLDGRITGASDIDLLVTVPDDLDETETYVGLSKALEDRLGSAAYVLDLHVVRRGRVDRPPYRWWLGRSHKVR